MGYTGQASADDPPHPQVGSGHSEDGLSGSSGLVHNHVALPDLSRQPDSYGGESSSVACAEGPLVG